MPFKISKFFLYISVFASVIVTTSTLFPFIVGKYAWFRASVDLALIAFLIGLVATPDGPAWTGRLKAMFRSPLGIALTIFTAAVLLACLFGVNPANSFWSNFERGEGGLQILHFYVFFVLLATLFRDRRDWERMFFLMLIVAVGMVIYGVGAGIRFTDAETTTTMGAQGPVTNYTGRGGPIFSTFRAFIGPTFDESGFRFQGSIGNPAYVAAFLIFSLFYSAYLLLTRYRGRLRSVPAVAIGIGMLIFFTVFMTAATRGAFLGLGAGLVAAATYLGLSNRRARPWMIGAIAALFVILFSIVGLRRAGVLTEGPIARLGDISFTTRTFADRMVIWRIAWDGFKDRPLFGWGPENFGRVFDVHFNPVYFDPAAGFGAWFDRAHNFVFDYLATTGVIGLAAYVGIFIAWAVELFRSRKRERLDGAPRSFVDDLPHALMIAAIMAYLVQALVLFDVLVIYINLFLFLAFSVFVFRPAEEEQPAPVRSETARWLIAAPGVVLAAAGIVYGAYMPLIKSQRYIAFGREGIANVRTVEQFIDAADEVFEYPSPIGQEEAIRFLGNDIMRIIGGQQPQPEPVARALGGYMGQWFYPDETRHALLKGAMHAILWRQYQREEDFVAAAAELRAGLEHGPKLPPLLYALFDLYRAKGDINGAREVGARILSLWPNDTRIKAALGLPQ